MSAALAFAGAVFAALAVLALMGMAAWAILDDVGGHRLAAALYFGSMVIFVLLTIAVVSPVIDAAVERSPG